MTIDEGAKVTLRDLINPELGAWTARVEALEREKAARGEFVEIVDTNWLLELEKQVMVEPDRHVVELLIGHANLMAALMLHRRISNLERASDEDTR